MKEAIVQDTIATKPDSSVVAATVQAIKTGKRLPKQPTTVIDPFVASTDPDATSVDPKSTTKGDNFPKVGTIIGYTGGSVTGTRRAIIADGNNGYTYGADEADPNYTASVIPGSTGTTIQKPERTLASDTFKNTFALAFGASEASQAYVGKLYQMVSGFYKTGSTIDESLNLALHEAQTNKSIPEFTARFAGLFSLMEKAQSGMAVQVPTIAEFVAAENSMGNILRSAGMGDLATQSYLGQIIGQGKSVSDVANAINTSFNAIDNAPQAVKNTLASQFPMLDRTTLAKSLLMGSDGAAEVQKKINMATTVTAASQQNVTGLTDEQKQMIATSGLSYGQQLQGFANVNLDATRGQTLTDIYGKAVEGYGQTQAIQDQFQGLASAQRRKQQLVAREQANFAGSSGTLGASYGTPRSAFNKPSAGQI